MNDLVAKKFAAVAIIFAPDFPGGIVGIENTIKSKGINGFKEVGGKDAAVICEAAEIFFRIQQYEIANGLV